MPTSSAVALQKPLLNMAKDLYSLPFGFHFTLSNIRFGLESGPYSLSIEILNSVKATY